MKKTKVIWSMTSLAATLGAAATSLTACTWGESIEVYDMRLDTHILENINSSIKITTHKNNLSISETYKFYDSDHEESDLVQIDPHDSSKIICNQEIIFPNQRVTITVHGETSNQEDEIYLCPPSTYINNSFNLVWNGDLTNGGEIDLILQGGIEWNDINAPVSTKGYTYSQIDGTHKFQIPTPTNPEADTVTISDKDGFSQTIHIPVNNQEPIVRLISVYGDLKQGATVIFGLHNGVTIDDVEIPSGWTYDGVSNNVCTIHKDPNPNAYQFEELVIAPSASASHSFSPVQIVVPYASVETQKIILSTSGNLKDGATITVHLFGGIEWSDVVVKSEIPELWGKSEGEPYQFTKTSSSASEDESVKIGLNGSTDYDVETTIPSNSSHTGSGYFFISNNLQMNLNPTATATIVLNELTMDDVYLMVENEPDVQPAILIGQKGETSYELTANCVGSAKISLRKSAGELLCSYTVQVLASFEDISITYQEIMYFGGEQTIIAQGGEAGETPVLSLVGDDNANVSFESSTGLLKYDKTKSNTVITIEIEAKTSLHSRTVKIGLLPSIPPASANIYVVPMTNNLRQGDTETTATFKIVEVGVASWKEIQTNAQALGLDSSIEGTGTDRTLTLTMTSNATSGDKTLTLNATGLVGIDCSFNILPKETTISYAFGNQNLANLEVDSNPEMKIIMKLDGTASNEPALQLSDGDWARCVSLVKTNNVGEYKLSLIDRTTHPATDGSLSFVATAPNATQINFDIDCKSTFQERAIDSQYLNFIGGEGDKKFNGFTQNILQLATQNGWNTLDLPSTTKGVANFSDDAGLNNWTDTRQVLEGEDSPIQKIKFNNNITLGERCFYRCFNIHWISIPTNCKFDLKDQSEWSYTFRGCNLYVESLKKITLDNFIFKSQEQVKIKSGYQGNTEYWFLWDMTKNRNYNSLGLGATTGNFTINKEIFPTYAPSAFASCGGINGDIIVDYIDTNFSIGSFGYCTNITSMTFYVKDSNGSNISLALPASCFDSCMKMVSFQCYAIREKISNWAFYKCTNLRKIIMTASIPEAISPTEPYKEETTNTTFRGCPTDGKFIFLNATNAQDWFNAWIYRANPWSDSEKDFTFGNALNWVKTTSF